MQKLFWVDKAYYGQCENARCTVAQKSHTCKLKMLLQIKNSTGKLKIVHAN